MAYTKVLVVREDAIAPARESAENWARLRGEVGEAVLRVCLDESCATGGERSQRQRRVGPHEDAVILAGQEHSSENTLYMWSLGCLVPLRDLDVDELPAAEIILGAEYRRYWGNSEKGVIAEGPDSKVTVSRKDFLDAFAPAARLLPKEVIGETPIEIDKEGEGLRFGLPGVDAIVPGTGAWHGVVLVRASFLRMIGLDLPPGDPIVIEVRDGKLHVGERLHGDCRVVTPVGPPIRVSLGAPLAELLRVRQDYPAEAIDRSGLTENVRAAEKSLDAAAVRAAGTLGSLGIQPQDVRALLERWLRETNPQPGPVSAPASPGS